MVLAAAGGVDHEHLVELGKKYFGGIEHGSEGVLAYEPGAFKQSYVSSLLFVSLLIQCNSGSFSKSLSTGTCVTAVLRSKGRAGHTRTILRCS